MSSPEKVDSEGTDKPQRHAEYYFADMIIFLVEDELFKVPRRNFAMESEIFSDMFQLPAPTDGTLPELPEGLSDDRPISLDGIKKSDFIQLLRVMFPLDSQSLSSEEWISVLKLSDMWQFKDIRARAIKALGSLTLSADLDLVDKIVTARKPAVSSWLVPSLHALLQRKQRPGLSEGNRLGLEWALKGLLLCCDSNIDAGSQPSVPLIDIQPEYLAIIVDRAIYRDRIRLEREFPPPFMLEVIRQRVGQDEDMFLAATSIFTSSENEAVDLGLVDQSQYKSLLRYRDECRARAAAVANPPHFHFKWMSPDYNWFKVNEEHDCNRGGNIFIANVQGKSMMRYWWRDYIYEAKSRLQKRPWGATVTSGDFFDKALEDGSYCRVCKKDLDRDFRQFTDIFASEIDDAVSQVVFENL